MFLGLIVLTVLQGLCSGNISFQSLTRSHQTSFFSDLVDVAFMNCSSFFISKDADEDAELEDLVHTVSQKLNTTIINIHISHINDIKYIQPVFCANFILYYLDNKDIAVLFNDLRHVDIIGGDVYSYIFAQDKTTVGSVLPKSDISKCFWHTVVIVGRNSSNPQLSISYKIYRNLVYNGGIGDLSVTAAWSRGKWWIMKHPSFWNLTQNLRGAKLKVATIPYATFVIKEQRADEAVKYTGVNFMFLDLFSDKLKFSYKVVEPKDKVWGRMQSNGTYSGLIGMSQQEISDVSVTAIGITPERARVVTFTFPWAHDSNVFAAPMPLDIPKWKSPILVYSPLIWLMMFVVVLTTVILLQGVNRLHNPVNKSRKNTAIHIMQLHIDQSVDHIHTNISHSFGILIVCYLIYLFFITNFYKNSLLSELTVTRKEREIHTYKDLLESQFPIAIQDYGGISLDMYRKSVNPIMRQIGSKMKPMHNPKEALDRVMQRKLVSFDYISNFDILIGKYFTDSYGKPRVVISKTSKSPFFWYAAMLIRKSSLTKPFNKLILQSQASGLEIKFLQDINAHLMHRGNITARNNLLVLSLENVQGSFMALGLGFIAGVVILLLEIIDHKRLQGILTLPAMAAIVRKWWCHVHSCARFYTRARPRASALVTTSVQEQKPGIFLI